MRERGLSVMCLFGVMLGHRLTKRRAMRDPLIYHLIERKYLPAHFDLLRIPGD